VGIRLIVTALTLPVVAGERSWPWWLALVSGALGFLGFFKANYGRIEIVDGRGGIPREMPRRSPRTASYAACCLRLATYSPLL
jgi:hypothetical protein